MLNQRKDEKKCSKWVIWSIVCAFAVSGLLLICYLIYRTQCKPPPSSSSNEISEGVGVKAVSDAQNEDDVENKLAEEVKKIGNQEKTRKSPHRPLIDAPTPSPSELCKKNSNKSDKKGYAHETIETEAAIPKLPYRPSKSSPIESSQKKDIASIETPRRSSSEVGISASPNRPLTGSPKSSSPTLQEQQRTINKCLDRGIKQGCTVTVKSSGRDRTFVVDKTLGKGSCGTVWSASEQDNEHFKVAIKFQQTKDDEFFENEATVTKEIHEELVDHGVEDHTVTFIGSIEDYQPVDGFLILGGRRVRYVDVIVMGLFDTDAWKHFKINQRRDPEDALKITKRITKVAQIMWNEKGLIARDIKLDNIFLKVKGKQITSSALGDHGMVVDKKKLTSEENLRKCYQRGTNLSPYALLQLYNIGFPGQQKLDFEENSEKWIQSNVVYDINMAVAFMLLPKEIMDVFQEISTHNAIHGGDRKLREGRNEVWKKVKNLARHIKDKEKFKEGQRKISMEELMVWTFWASFKQIEIGGNEDYMVTLNEYAKMVDRVKLDSEYENVALNKALYGAREE